MTCSDRRGDWSVFQRRLQDPEVGLNQLEKKVSTAIYDEMSVRHAERSEDRQHEDLQAEWRGLECHLHNSDMRISVRV